MTAMPEPPDLEMIGRAIIMCNHIEELARHIAVLPLERRTGLQLPDLLLGSRGTWQAQQFLAVSTESIADASPDLDPAIRWLKEADSAIERRNDLLHRPVGMRVTSTPGQGHTMSGGGALRLRRSRRRHEFEDLSSQYQDLLVLLEDVWARGRTVRNDLAAALAPEGERT